MQIDSAEQRSKSIRILGFLDTAFPPNAQSIRLAFCNWALEKPAWMNPVEPRQKSPVPDDGFNAIGAGGETPHLRPMAPENGKRIAVPARYQSLNYRTIERNWCRTCRRR
jgi:hypothetical protein